MYKQWQLDAPPAPGRHSRMDPALGAQGYPPIYHGQVLRAITVEGTVTDGPVWTMGPQMGWWRKPERMTLWERIVWWLTH